MKDENQAPVEQPENSSGNEGKKDTVAYDSYAKLLNEKKSVQSKLSEYEARMQKLEEEKLQAEGNKDELLNKYRGQLDEMSKKLETTSKNYAWNTLTGEIKREAMKHGCINPDKLIRVMDDSTLESIRVGDDFSIDQESLSMAIESAKKDNDFLFRNPSKPFSPGKPSNKPIEEKEEDIKKLSIDELKERYKKLNK